MTRWRKTQYIALIVSAIGLVGLQVIYCVFGIVNAHSNSTPIEFFDLLGYIGMFLTFIVSVFTIRVSLKRLRWVNEVS